MISGTVPKQQFDCPQCQRRLSEKEDHLTCGEHRFPIVGGIPRFVETAGYADSFSYQWNVFTRTQIDSADNHQSSDRLWIETGWDRQLLEGQHVLEVGSGAGRFTSVLMKESSCSLVTIDYSTAVDANRLNNQAFIDEGRLLIGQASVYDLPLADRRFAKVVCLGVLQHTPDFRASLCALFDKVQLGGQLVVDFYAIRGWYTKFNAKYFLRPLTIRLSHPRLHALIRATVPFSLALSRGLERIGLKVLTRFLPICDVNGTLPPGLTHEQTVEWCVLDTLDMYSPAYDNPQRIATVARWLVEMGAHVDFADFVEVQPGNRAAVVRATKIK